MRTGQTITAVLILIAAGVASAGPAASSSSYTMDYAVISSAGAAANSNSFKVVARVKTDGVSGGSPASASYSVGPLAGTVKSAANVSDWTLY